MAIQKPNDIAAIVEKGIRYQKAANWDFDLGIFRWHTAKMCKCMIQAREIVNTGFLGNAQAYARWKLPESANGPRECRTLLMMANDTAKLVWSDILDMGGSGGLDPCDPLAEFKNTVLEFLTHDSPALQRAIELAGEGKQQEIGWDSVAKWGDLSKIRDVLDLLPEPSPGKPPAETRDFPTLQAIADFAKRSERTIRNWRDQKKLHIVELPNGLLQIDLQQLEQVNEAPRPKAKKEQ